MLPVEPNPSFNAIDNRVRPIETLVIQATPFCNLDCVYCYLPHRNDRRHMEMETLDLVCRRVFKEELLAHQLTVAWHAGEPMVLPTTYFRQAFSRIEQFRPPSLHLVHKIQTNGTLIDDDWIRLIQEYGIEVGLSLDGPRHLHDATRRRRNKRGSFDAAIDGLHRLQDASIPVRVITVLTRNSLAEPDALYDFYRDTGICDVAFNIEEIEGANRESTLDDVDAPAAYKNFLKHFLRRMDEAGGTIRLRELDDARATILGSGNLANPQAEPFRIVSVAWNGDLSTFSPELLGTYHSAYGEFSFGNVRNDELTDLERRPLFGHVCSDIAAGVELCRHNCAYFPVCGGGAPANKLFENGSFASQETLFCRLTRQALIDVVLDRIEADFANSKVSSHQNKAMIDTE
jgi:uncharacterized protein